MTKYGKMIVEVVSSGLDHPTAEQIYQNLRENGIHISLATVYNNLKTLAADGILRKITTDGSPDRFDFSAEHQHLVCAGCGRLQDVNVRDLHSVLSQDTGEEVLSYDLHVYYLCPDCRRNRKEKEVQLT